MYRTNKKKLVRQVGVSVVVALGALVTGVGVANASTHASTKTYVLSTSSTTARTARTSSNAAAASLAAGEDALLTLSSTDATLETAVDIGPANLAGKVTTVAGDVITVAGPDGK